jgi:hypothetical protein
MARAKTSFWTRSLEKVRGVLLHGPSEPASRPKKTAESAMKRSPGPGTQSDATGVAKTQDDKAPKKKIPVQPWYRHRQRW